MNGRTHVVIGAASPLFLITAGADLGQLLLLSGIAAGAALGPDIDHPNATATRALGSSVHKVVHSLSKTVRWATSTKADRSAATQWEGLGRDADHRALTHTGVSSVAVGAAAFAACMVPFGDTGVAALFGWLAAYAISRAAAPLVAVGLAALSVVSDVPAWMAATAVTLGWLSHVLADGCTVAGVPLLWPLKRRGRRWAHTRILGKMLRSGADAEWIVAVAMVALMVLPFVATMRNTR